MGGDKFDEAITRYIRRQYNLLIGERTAEEIKIAVGSAIREGRPDNPRIDVGAGSTNRIAENDCCNSQESFNALRICGTIVGGVKEVLERTPPDCQQIFSIKELL